MAFFAVQVNGPFVPELHPYIIGWAGQDANDPMRMPVIEDLGNFVSQCNALNMQCSHTEVTQQYQNGMWVLPMQTIIVPRFGSG